MYYRKKKKAEKNNDEINNKKSKVQYRINSKGEKRKILLSIPLISFIVFLILLYILTIEIHSMYYQVDMNDVIKNFDVQLSTNTMYQMNYNSFQYEIENLDQVEADEITGSRVVRKRDNTNIDYNTNYNGKKYNVNESWYNRNQFKNTNEEQTDSNDVSTNNYVTSTGEKYHIIANLKIPDLNIEYPILSSTSEELLKISITKYWGASPNEVGNMVVLGHNYESKRFFSKLHEAKNGMKIYVTDLNGKTLEYTVYDTQIIDPYDNSCTSQLTDGHTDLTLITCYNRDKNRFVVKARAN